MKDERSSYRQIEHTADLGVEVTASELAPLFSTASEALYSLIANPATIENRSELTVSATGTGVEELLHAWLCELLALFNTDGFIGKRCAIVHLSDERVEGKIAGEKLDLTRHDFHTEIKGVTYHDYRVWNENGEWHARVIFDV